MEVTENHPLRNLNTFGVSANAKYFCIAKSESDILKLLGSEKYKHSKLLILGGGSNILLTDDFDGLVLKIDINFIDNVDENDDHVWIRVGSGVNWHDFVMSCLEKDFGGVENLSLIPGTMGAAPMQNIGAYGVELKEVFVELSAIDRETLQIEKFNKERCEFGYRESIFKKEARDKYIITSVTLRLNKKPVTNIEYEAIESTLTELDITYPTIRDVSNAVIKIRQSKLPDPGQLGNAGSFFKNPIVDKIDYEYLYSDFPNIPGYKLKNDKVKIPAAWLIDQCGWKGKRLGDVGVHKDHALVVVNHGNGSGKEVKHLAMEIKNSVILKFGIELTSEVNII